MTALDTTTHARTVSPGAAAVTLRMVKTALGVFARALVHRRQALQLRELSDHQLADIGLTRSDLSVALHAPLGTDPTTRLSTLARERYWADFQASAARHTNAG